MKMKIRNIIILISLFDLAYSKEPSVLVTKQKIKNVQKSALEVRMPDEEFRIKSIEPKSGITELVIPTYSSVSTRVADVNISHNRMEIAIQIDEFYVEYSDYTLINGKWKLKVKKNVCELSGLLASRIAVAEIHEGGIVEIKYHEGITDKKILNWDNELIQKIHQDNDKLLSERYILKNNEFQLLGKSVRLRPQK